MAQGSGDQYSIITPQSSLQVSAFSSSRVIFVFPKSSDSTPHYKIIRDGSDLTSFLPESDFAPYSNSSTMLQYTDNTAYTIEIPGHGGGHIYQVQVASDTSGTNASNSSSAMTLGVVASVMNTYDGASFVPISTNSFNYTAEGGIGVHRLRQHDPNTLGGMEMYQSKRKTKWFTLGDYENDAKIRRVRLNYRSNRPVTIKIYKDHQDAPTHSLEFPQATNQKIRYKKATLRAKVVQIEIVSQNIAGHYLEIYGMELETSG